MSNEPSISGKLTTEKNRVRRHYFDRVSGKCVDSVAQIDRKKSLDESAVESFLHIGFVPGNRTLFDGVDCLPGGCVISFHNKQWAIEDQFLYRDVVDASRYRSMATAELAGLGGRSSSTLSPICLTMGRHWLFH